MIDRGANLSRAQQEASARARWMAEVGEALGEAQRLTAQLTQWPFESQEAILLRVRIMAVRTEVEALQRSRPAPEWIKRAAPRPDQIP